MTYKEIIGQSVYADTAIKAIRAEIDQLHQYEALIGQRDDDLRERLNDQIQRIEMKRKIVDDFIEKISDPEIKQIIHLRFFRHKSWTEVNCIVYGYPDSQYSFRRIDRYFQKQDLTGIEKNLHYVHNVLF